MRQNKYIISFISVTLPERELLEQIWNAARPHLHRILLSIFAGLGFAAVNAGFYYFLRPALGKILQPSGRLWPILLLVLGFYLVKGVLYFASEYLSISVIQDMIVHSRKTFLRNYLFRNHHPDMRGEEVSKFFEDINQMCGAVKLFTAGLVKDTLTILGLLVVLFIFMPGLALMVLVVYLLSALPLRWLSKRMRQAAEISRQTNARLLARLVEMTTFHKELKSSRTDPLKIAQLEETLHQEAIRQKALSRVDRLTPAAMEWAGALGFAALVYLAGDRLFQQLNLGGAVAFAIASFALYGPLKSMGNFHVGLQRALASTRRVSPYFRTPAISVIYPPFRREVVLELSHCYARNEKVILNPLKLNLRKSEALALVGPNGAGKSTLLLCLAGLLPFEKRLIIDGQMFMAKDHFTWPEWVFFAGNPPALFNDTLLSNITLGRAADPELVFERVERTGLAHKLRRMGMGLQTRIGENGQRLSLGMRQRLVMARALFHRPKLLLLDEVFSAIEAREAAELFGRLRHDLPDCTFVLATRDIHLAQTADRVALMWEGELVARGRHAELLAKNPLYQAFWQQKHKDEKYESLPHVVS